MTEPLHRVIRPAVLDEAPLLHELTRRSTLYWGYEPEFLEWEPEALAVTPDLLDNSTTNVLEEDGRVVGYYTLVGTPPRVTLDKLFVDPEMIGTGRGKVLWRHAVETARAMGATVLTFAADPNAAPFYRAMAAEWLREEPTSWPGWALQIFRFRIPDSNGSIETP
jgi:GNAT superfamily N-acetyltransferase